MCINPDNIGFLFFQKFQKGNFLHEKGERCLLNLNHSPDKNKWGSLGEKASVLSFL